MDKLKLLFFIIGFCLCLTSFSQSFEEDIRDALSKKPILDLRSDSRHSFINQSGVSVFGIKGGIEYDRKLRFGLGINVLVTPLYRTVTYREEGVLKADNNARLGMYLISPYVEYVFYKSKNWEMSVPVQIGIGSSYYSYNTKLGQKTYAKKIILSYEPAITVQYKVLKYFGPGVGIGYRLMLLNNKAIKENLTSPVYIFRMKIFFGEIYRDIFKKEE